MGPPKQATDAISFDFHGASVKNANARRVAGRCFPSDCKTRLVVCTKHQCVPLPPCSNCASSVEPSSAVTDDAPPEMASMMRSK